METHETKNTTSEPAKHQDISSPDNKGRVMGGIVIIAIGSLLLARKTGVALPDWLFTWPMLVIAIGVFAGAKHSFRHPGWLIPVAIGTVFLIFENLNEIDSKQFFWPVVIIAAGLFMIFRPKRRRSEAWRRWADRRHDRFHQKFDPTFVEESSEGLIDSVTIFGGTKKVVISKDFRGGEAVTVFGGVEINLTQSDIQDRAELELVQVFGGAKLVVPANWRIQVDEMVSIFGGVDDKRNPATLNPDNSKLLILKGTSIFGGIDIKSY